MANFEIRLRAKDKEITDLTERNAKLQKTMADLEERVVNLEKLANSSSTSRSTSSSTSSSTSTLQRVIEYTKTGNRKKNTTYYCMVCGSSQEGEWNLKRHHGTQHPNIPFPGAV